MNTTEFRVMTSGAFTAAHLALLQQVERLTQKKVITASTAVGSGENSLHNRLKRGEVVDIVIVADELLRQFIDEGLVRTEGYTRLARSSVGMAVRAGAAKPDISNAEALKRTLLAANAIGHSISVSGQYVTGELLERLGIAAEVRPKCRLVTGEPVGAVLARGEIDIGFQQMSELLPVPGIAHITPLPQALQKPAFFAAGVAASAPDAALSRRVIEFLASPQAAEVIRKSGLEPLV